MTKVLLLLSISFFAIRSFALDCPKQVLQCQLISYTQEGLPKIDASGSSDFFAYNDDEPSESDSKCASRVVLNSLVPNVSLNAVVRGEDERSLYAFVYAWNSQERKVEGNQAALSILPGQEFSLSYGQQQIHCQLK